MKGKSKQIPIINYNSLQNIYNSKSFDTFSKYRGGKMEDKNMTCKDCGSEFVWTSGEQEFYKQKGFENEPTRCPSCRRARKQQRRF